MTSLRSVAIGLPLLALVACATEPDVIINGPPEHVEDSSLSVEARSSLLSETTNAESSQATSQAVSTAGQTVSIPGSVRISMPFASQAPTGNWDPPYDEACEEASLIIVHHYLQGTPLDSGIMDREINEMVDYETSVGLPIDIDMHELANVAEAMYGYRTEVVEGDDVTAARIEWEIAAGNPVIVPLAGQDIGNPYYSGDGPPYHVLVIVGYDANNFTTHDVGTRRGENYTYRKEVIMSAIHDWNGSVETIRSGPQRLLIVKK